MLVCINTHTHMEYSATYLTLNVKNIFNIVKRLYLELMSTVTITRMNELAVSWTDYSTRPEGKLLLSSSFPPPLPPSPQLNRGHIKVTPSHK